MRPDRADIPVPPLPPGTSWFGGEPPAAERLTARGPLLVLFFEAGELSGVRTLPHIAAIAKRYADAGLVTLAVHTPRSGLARDDAALAAALAPLDLPFPVANDREYRIWHAYGCKGWPSLFLWGQGGTLRWFHFGEGSYAETEQAVREELTAGGEERQLPAPAIESPAERVELIPPSHEVFPGGAHDSPWKPAPGEPLEISYTGAGCWAAFDGGGEVGVTLDGGEPTTVEVRAPGLYELASHGTHGIHEIRLELPDTVRLWSVSFQAGPRA